MTASVKNHERPYCHPAFYGLSDRDLVSVYNTTAVRKLNTGDILVKEGDTDEKLYLILEGSAQISKRVNDTSRQISVLAQGDSIPGASSSENGTRTTSALALEPLSVFVLDETILNAMSPKVQLAVYKNLNNIFVRQVNDLIASQGDLSDRNEYLTSHVARFLRARTAQYENSEMILGFLKGIPRLPMYANRLAVVLADENVSTRDVAELAKLDPSLVSVVLKMVNSAYYGFQRKISDFEHAVLLLGFNQVYQLVMDIGIRSTMPKTPAFQELLFHSMMISFVGFEISQLSHVRKAVTISTIGLLHDIGHSVILLLKQKHPKIELLIDMLDQSKIGSLLLKQWNIPEVVCNSLEYQSYPEWLPPGKIPQQYRHYTAVLYIAHLCCAYMQGKREGELPLTFLGEYMEVINCPEGSIAELVEKRVLPSLHRKLKTFPQNVRQFVTEAEDNIVTEKKTDI